MTWTARKIERANWRTFLIGFALLFAYSWWAFMTPGPWTTIYEATGGRLPEMSAGFPGTQPAEALEALGDKRADYLLFQAVDIPYAILNVIVFAGAISMALKRFALAQHPIRHALYAPYAYLFCEIIENSLLAAFASGAVPASEPIVLVQQLATTVKLVAGYASVLGAFLALVSIGVGAVLSVRPK